MSSVTTSAAQRVSRNSARYMVRQLHNHIADQRQAVMECRNRAEAMSASGVARDSNAGAVESPSPVCFAEVTSEKDVVQSFIPYGLLSGITVAVSDALDVLELNTRSGLHPPTLRDTARREFPLISWVRSQGAQIIGKLSCRTPFALSEGTIFGPEEFTSLAVTERACDYAISCSLNGPSSVLCAVNQDMVGFKPTSQTFGTFTERFELWLPSMTVGLSARRIDDLMFLWQVYTASIDPEVYFQSTTTKHTQSSTFCTSPRSSTSSPPSGSTDSGASSSSTTASELNTAHQPTNPSGDALPASAPSTTADLHAGGSSHQQDSSPAVRSGQSISRWWSGKVAPEVQHPDDMPKYARPGIPDHNPYNYTVRDRRGHIADIDVGWRDYNAAAAMIDDLDQPSRPGFLRRLFTGDKAYETPRVELAVGYPAEWIDRYCKGKYKSSAEFHQRITDAVYMHSALHYNQKLEIVPLAFDFSIEEVMEAVTTISHYELAKAFERSLAPVAASASIVGSQVGSTAHVTEDAKYDSARGLSGNRHREENSSTVSSPEAVVKHHVVPDKQPIEEPQDSHDAAPDGPNAFRGVPGVLWDELPKSILDSVEAGQRLSFRDYHHALRVRDDVVRSTEEQFTDVDCLVTPLLSDPYTSGDLRSVRLTLPFQLAGNPILSMQVDPQTPVAIVGELGRDAALMEDAFCFLQFVRGASPSWWRQRVFGEGAASAPGVGQEDVCGAAEPATLTLSTK
ncbi:hypothetical protein JKF63_05489 [Porcisia hertigi]|uniref:Amidase domain-containing protein n=1 Tax=Porcisia hertigi TaxID=2761500 RepID=A0A836ISN6_9TRYP|nr:hypothetical protein JKF63_05489 [Porcisia hertigi]